MANETEIPEDDLDFPEGWEEEDWDEPPRRRPTTMRHPVLLVLIVLGAGFLFIKNWPKAIYMVKPAAECGSISERPILRSNKPEALPELTHDRYCHLTGSVQTFNILATGQETNSPDPYRRQRGRKYYLKLDGDKVFVVLAADRKDVVDFRTRKGQNLLGFEIDERGRMIDPDADPQMAATARTLRTKYGLPDSESIRIFDTTHHPRDRWPYAAVCGLMIFTILLALFGIFRIFRTRQND